MEKQTQLSNFLYTNDYYKYLINIDSRFRNNIIFKNDEIIEPSTDFLYRFEIPHKNIISLKVSTVEIYTNNILNISDTKQNSWFTIKIFNSDGKTITDKGIIKILPGYYTSQTLVDAIQVAFDNTSPFLDMFRIELVKPYNKIMICMDISSPTHSFFEIDFTIPVFQKRMVDWGLGYILGFREKIIKSPIDSLDNPLSIPGESCIISSCPPNLIIDPYIFISLNNFTSVFSKSVDNNVQALAKIPLHQEGVLTIPDILVTTDFVFPSPIDLKQIHVQLLDAYSNIVYMPYGDFSFSIEVTELVNIGARKNH